ncbi:hypothetical protein C0991_011800 [Blastosporella zonata]|nr:hypothetical protein C0991_011800 [Blastosporella zonata]
MFSSHTYTLTDAIDIYFTDSGPPSPSSTDYTTVIAFHGSAFNGESFEKLRTYGHGYNLRTVIWNRRGFPGSSKYSDADIDDLQNGRNVFLDRLAILVGDFVKQFVEQESVPKISADRRSGGIALLGWSMGCPTAMALFSNPNIFSKETYTLLEAYVKDLVLDDPPIFCFGMDIPANAEFYNPWTDPNSKTEQETADNFMAWVSSYYDHPDFHAASLDNRKRTDHTTSFIPEQLKRYDTGEAAARSEFPMCAQPMQSTLKNFSDRVLYDEKLTQTFFPKVPVTYVGATRTLCDSAWAYLETKRKHEEDAAKGKKAVLDHPKEFIDQVVAGIRA